MAGNDAKRPRKRVKITPAQKARDGEGDLDSHWRTYFLQALAATSNVTRSAHEAGVPLSRAYKTRREHAGFAAQWRKALCEGYEHLEMEVLACLRGNDFERKLDVANAIRLLAAHRKTVAETRAFEEEEDEQAVLDSIDAMIDRMRSRSEAARQRAARSV
ncbi:hypothetical protein [Pelagerythrobacter sp.]|uniref:hypothetical protein n=1 Tax=Pelagerythrobacter sp. TaxID=2800702 RepID=UPI0035B38FCE